MSLGRLTILARNPTAVETTPMLHLDKPIKSVDSALSMCIRGRCGAALSTGASTSRTDYYDAACTLAAIIQNRLSIRVAVQT